MAAHGGKPDEGRARSSAEGGAQVDDDHDDDLRLGDLGSMFKSMRDADEEPPSTGMAALMAAARAKAEEMKPQPSWWEKILAGLRRPPVLAFASVAILVGGGALIMRHQDGMSSKNAEVVRADEPRAMAPAAPTPTPAPIEEAAPGAGETEGANDQTRIGSMKGDAVEKQKEVTIHRAPARPAPRSSASKEAVDSFGDSAAAPEAPMAAGGLSASPTLEQQIAQWEAAAAANNCALANRLGAQIRARDQAAYATTFKKNAAIAACSDQK